MRGGNLMRVALALVEAVWSTRGVRSGCWGGLGDGCDGIGEWTYSAHWLSRER
jgi:hypothetical protein